MAEAQTLQNEKSHPEAPALGATFQWSENLPFSLLRVKSGSKGGNGFKIHKWWIPFSGNIARCLALFFFFFPYLALVVRKDLYEFVETDLL